MVSSLWIAYSHTKSLTRALTILDSILFFAIYFIALRAFTKQAVWFASTAKYVVVTQPNHNSVIAKT